MKQMKQMKQIYLDYAASTPIDKAVFKEMQKYSYIYANPSSMHSLGFDAKAIIEKSRKKIAIILNCKPEEIIFTSGGTESNNLALQGLSISTIITTEIEHQSILKTVQFLERKGVNVIYLPVTKEGKINLLELEKAIKPNFLISIGYVNNEVGAVQDLQAISQIIQKKKIEFGTNSIFFHIDACQAEYEELNMHKSTIDLLTLNSSKIYGPKGVGLLYKKKSVQLQPIILGGEQEFSIRAGTENIFGIVGFAKALEINYKTKKNEKEKIIKFYNYFLNQIKLIENIKVNSQKSHIISLTIKDCDSQTILNHLDQEKIYASAGSACNANNIEPSHVLKAIGLSDEEAMSTIRFSLGRFTTKKEINFTIKKLKLIVQSLRSLK